MWLALVLALLLPASASAHTLQKGDAKRQADEVAAFVGGVVAGEYRLRRYGVEQCIRHSVHRHVCEGRWDLVSRGRRPVAWTCRADIVVWFEDEESEEPDWDYGRVRCQRKGLARSARRV